MKLVDNNISKIWLVVFIILLIIVFSYIQITKPAPQKSLTIATGKIGSDSYAYALSYKALLEDEGVSPDKYITQELMRQDLQKLIGELTTQQQQVVRLRFGLEDGKELSLAKIGQRMNISRERVRQLEQQALAHLRKKRSSVREYIVAS